MFDFILGGRIEKGKKENGHSTSFSCPMINSYCTVLM